MAGYTFIRWWHYLLLGSEGVARLRASNSDYMKANSIWAFIEKRGASTQEMSDPHSGE